MAAAVKQQSFVTIEAIRFPGQFRVGRHLLLHGEGTAIVLVSLKNDANVC